jgi:hypothetical protein
MTPLGSRNPMLWPSYLAYAITFLLIGQVWANITSCSTHGCRSQARSPA